MKECQITNTHTHTHTHPHTHARTQENTHTHPEVDFFFYSLFLLTMLVSFKCQMSKELLITLRNVLFHAFTKLKPYEQVRENHNSNFKMHGICCAVPYAFS